MTPHQIQIPEWFTESFLDIREDVAEAEFYLRQGLAQDALRIYERLLDLFPDNEEFQDKVQALRGEVTDADMLRWLAELGLPPPEPWDGSPVVLHDPPAPALEAAGAPAPASRAASAPQPTNPFTTLRKLQPDHPPPGRAEMAEVFQRVNCLALPNQAGSAPLVKDVKPLDALFKHVVPEYHGPFNLTGLPTLSVPCGFSEDNLPIALQIVGKPFDEITVLRAGYTYQQHMKWYERRPVI